MNNINTIINNQVCLCTLLCLFYIPLHSLICSFATVSLALYNYTDSKLHAPVLYSNV